MFRVIGFVPDDVTSFEVLRTFKSEAQAIRYAKDHDRAVVVEDADGEPVWEYDEMGDN